MTPDVMILIVGLVFLVVLLVGAPLAIALGGLGVIFGFTMWDNPAVLNLFIRSITNVGTNLAYVSMFLFIFMGTLLERSGAADDMFESIYVIFGKVRGGIAIGVVVVCTMLAAASGIIGASISMMTMLALPSMMKNKYNKKLSYGTIMAAGCLGTIIPPSVILVIYGAQAQLSIAKLFAGGVGAGITLSVLYLVYIIVMTVLKPDWCPAIPPEQHAKYSTADKIKLVFRSIVPTVGLIILVLGSIMLGAATPTEAAALGSVGAALIALMYKKLNWQMIKGCLYDTFKTHAMIMWIILTASMFTSVFLGLGGAAVIEGAITSLALSRWFILAIICLIIVIMGMFIDSYGVLLIGIPVFTPVIYSLGFDPVWFAIVFAVLIQISYLSPPFAYAAFYLKGCAKEHIPIDDIYWASLPFLGLQILALILCCIFPEIITWLPSKIL